MDLLDTTSTPADVAVERLLDEPGRPWAALERVRSILSARRPGRWTAMAGLVALGAAGVALRFITTSALWLDEALTVNIARRPLGQIPAYLRKDGAPPLYYVLLHFWMQAFGSSDVAVRALSGVISVITIPVVWTLARRIGGRRVAVAATVLLVSSPFAIYYGTEARMYSLVALLTATGLLALDGVLRHPSWRNLLGAAASTTALLYTHYWSFYLIGAACLWLAWLAWRATPRRRRGARYALGAVAVGVVGFLPWLPTFLYQNAHTGTPWAAPSNFTGIIDAVNAFAGGPTNAGWTLTILIVGAAAIGAFGIAGYRRSIVLDLRGRPGARAFGFVCVVTLVAGIVGGAISDSGFSPRYATVVFVPLLLLAAFGFKVIADRRIATATLAAAVVLGALVAVPDITWQRTEATQLQRVLLTQAKPGDIVAYCPDQLGPDAARLLPANRFQQITFPRGTGPQFVNWTDYLNTVGHASVGAFERTLESMVQKAGPGHSIWYVWAGGYHGFAYDCDQINLDLQHVGDLQPKTMFSWAPQYYEQEQLMRFTLRGPTTTVRP